MNNYPIRPLKDIGSVERHSNYVIIHLSGLLGDTIHASTRFNHILEKHPDNPWIVIHSYPAPNIVQKRVQLVANNLMPYWFDNQKIKYYFFDGSGKGGNTADQIPQVMSAIRYLKAPDRLYDCVFRVNKYPKMKIPLLGIPIPQKKDPLKAVIMRFSGWHKHFMARNRPYTEWNRIERELLKYGYNVTIVGIDDPHPNPNNLQDLRKKLSVREVLEFTNDASICICPATFLYVWNQFVCPTFVLSDKGDVHSLNRWWKLNENMKVFNVNHDGYLAHLFREIHVVATRR